MLRNYVATFNIRDAINVAYAECLSALAHWLDLYYVNWPIAFVVVTWCHYVGRRV